MKRRRKAVLVLAVAALGLLCAAPAAPAAAPGARAAHGGGWQPGGDLAVIRRGAHDIPTITSRSFYGLGYGYGYAFAQDNLCQLADDLTTVVAQRSRYFGPDGRDSEGKNNLKSDFYYQDIIDRGTVERLLAQPYPQGPSREARDAVRGFAAGYDRYLERTGVDNLPDPRCRGGAWVRPISSLDLWRRYYQLALYASSGNFVEQIVDAQPPAAATAAASRAPSRRTLRLTRGQLTGTAGGLGSNAIALGRDATANGQGMLLGNPHFPWFGGRRFYESHLRIPGKIDVEGASLLGVPVINIGHNRDVAWSHTVSTAYRFTPYELTLVPGQPTRYRYDGGTEDMTSHTVTVAVRRPDGSLGQESHTFWRSRYGPIVRYPTAFLYWTDTNAYALKDANANNLRIADQWLAMDRARSVEGIRRALSEHLATPWVNTIAADRRGRALYADISTIPNVSNALVAKCATSPLAQLLFAAVGLPLLDGSRPDCAWGNDPGTVVPGIFGAEHLPSLVRTDYVENGNDSYWLSNPAQPLTGFARIIGDEGTTRSLRTRLGLIMIRERLNGTDGLRGKRFTLRRLQRVALGNRVYSGELLRDAVVALCRATPTVDVPGTGAVDLRKACDVLAAWDLRGDLDSRGEILWRAFFPRLTALGGGAFSVPFNLSDPVDTPNTLTTDSVGVLGALGATVADFAQRGLPLDVSVGEAQYRPVPGGRIPIHGCPGGEGCFNVIAGPRAADGTFQPTGGTSFITAVGFHGRRGVTARSILTYSQSANETSPFYSDQTRLFSQKRWVQTAPSWSGWRPHPARVTRLRR